MAGMTGPHLDAILKQCAAPSVFVESGTFHGKTTRLAVPRFRLVHTIELNREWYAEALEKLMPLGVECHFGNSAEIISFLAGRLREPVCWYLDAHWFSHVDGVAGKKEGLPLWQELKAIARRPYADLIIVDDVRDFGTDKPTPEWRDVTLDNIAKLFPNHLGAKIMGDQAVVYKAAA